MININPKLIGRTSILNSIVNTFKDNPFKEKYFVIYSSKGQGSSKLGQELKNSINIPLFIECSFKEFNKKIPLSGIKTILTQFFNRLEQNANLKNHLQTSLKNGLSEKNASLIKLFPKLQEYIPTSEGNVNLNILIKKLFKNITIPNIPLLFFLDDINYCDKASLEMLTNIIGDKNPIAFIITCKNEEKTNFSIINEKLSISKVNVNSFTLNDFNNEEVTLFINEIFENNIVEPQKLANIFKTKIPSNPLTILEALKLLIQKNFIYYNEKWYFEEEKIQNVELPNNISELLIERLKEFTDEELEILKYSSAIGKSFYYRILESISFKHPDLYDYTIINEVFSLSKDKGILEEVIHEVYIFTSKEVKDYLYNSLDTEAKAIYHELCAEYIFENYSNNENAIFELAYHYSRSDNLELGIEYLKKAALISKENFARNEALEYAKLALDSINYLTNTIENSNLKIEISFLYLEALRNTGDQHKGLEILDKIKDNIEQSGDNKLIAQLYYWYGEMNYLTDNQIAAIQWFLKCIPIAEENNLTDFLVLPYQVVGGAYFFRGEFKTGLEYIEKSFKHIEKDQYSFLCRSYGLMSWCYSAIGLRKQAIETANKSEALLDYIFNKDLLLGNYHLIATTYGWCGLLDKNYKYASKVIEEGEKNQNYILVYSAYFCMSFAYYNNYKYEQSIETILKALKYAELHNIKIGLHYAYNCLAGSQLELGQYDDAIKNATIGLEYTIPINNFYQSSEFYRMIGAAYHRKENPDYEKAEEYLLKALDFIKQTDNSVGNMICFGEYSAYLYKIGNLKKAEEYEKKCNEEASKSETNWIMKTIRPVIESAKKNISTKTVTQKTHITQTQANISPTKRPNVKQNILSKKIDIPEGIYTLKPFIDNLLELFLIKEKSNLTDILFKKLFSYTHFERGFIYVVNSGKLECLGARDNNNNDIIDDSNKICRQSIRNAILKKNNVFIKDASTNNDYKYYSSVHSRKIKSIYVSLIEERRANSILYLETLEKAIEVEAKIKEAIRYLQYISSIIFTNGNGHKE